MQLISSDVAERLRWYVYRLIDPRNGETFYVGKGRGNRVFQHVNALPVAGTEGEDEEDASDLKLQRIKEIRAAQLEVGHVIHRHNIENSEIAFQIEAALIDAYPGLSNRVIGHGSGDYGCRHIDQIISEYSVSPFEVDEPLILIAINRSYEEEGKDIYDAVRGCWRIRKERAKKYNLVLAHRRGLVAGAFRPAEWLPARREHFPWLIEDMPTRIGFVGKEADPAIVARYVGKRVPDQFRAKGAANPVRFVDPVGELPA